MRLLCFILFSLVGLYGCDDKLEKGCPEVNCTVSEASQTVNITYTNSNTTSLGVYAVFSPDAFETHGNNFSCSIPQTLIDAGFSISSTCDIYGTPLKTLTGNFMITIYDFVTTQDKSVLVEINVTGGAGCNGYGNEITIADFPTVTSPDFSFCGESDEYIFVSAHALGINLPGNNCFGTCTESLSILEAGTVDQSEQTILTAAHLAADYVVFDVAYPLSDLTLRLSPALADFCLLFPVPTLLVPSPNYCIQ